MGSMDQSESSRDFWMVKQGHSEPVLWHLPSWKCVYWHGLKWVFPVPDSLHRSFFKSHSDLHIIKQNYFACGLCSCCSNLVFLCSFSHSLPFSTPFLLSSPPFPFCVWSSLLSSLLLPSSCSPPSPFCGFVFPPSGVQMTILVIAVKPPLWPVSTVCPFLLPVCLCACLSDCLLTSCMLRMRWMHECLCVSPCLFTPYCVSILLFCWFDSSGTSKMQMRWELKPSERFTFFSHLLKFIVKDP